MRVGFDRHSLTVEVGWFFGYLDDVQVVYMDGRVDDASYARYVDTVSADIDRRNTCDEETPVFYHIPQPSALTAKRRALLATVLKEKESILASHTAAYAMVTTSSMVRYGLRVLFWLAPPPYPNGVLATPMEGFEFLARYDRSLNPVALTARYENMLARLMSQMGRGMNERFPAIPPSGGTDSSWTLLLEQIFEDAPLPLAILDQNGRPVRQNAAQLAFNEVEGARLGIGTFSTLDDPRAQAAGHSAEFKKALAFETVEYEFQSEQTVRGETTHSSYQRLFVPIGSKGGKSTAVISVLLDISERKRAEREQERLNAQLLHTRKLESLGVLAGGIAHDFNNLLMGVMGNASIVSAKLDPTSPLLKHVHAIEKAAQRAADVAQQMLAYAGKGRVERRLVDLSALVTDSSDLLRLSVAGRVELICELTPQLPPVEADVTQLQQVVLNLVTNACEAMEGKPGRVSLRTGLIDVDASYLSACFHGSGVCPGPFVYLEVEDSGHGIDSATLSRIFDPFFSTKFEGRGLGLAGVLGIVRGHMGAISVQSEVGRGTCFRALFPAKLGASASSMEGHTRRAPPRMLPRHVVLVVDDEELVRETASGMLRELGCKVLEADGGLEAVAIFRRLHHQIDTVLLDLTMPDLDGIATLRELSALDPKLHAIVMSGYDPVEAMTKVPRDRHTLFLRKPFTLGDLKGALASVRS